MDYTHIYLNQYSDWAFWAGSTVGALLDPILWIVVIGASLAPKHRRWAVVGAAIVYSIATAVMFDAGLHIPTRIIAGLIVGFAAIAVMDWRANRKATTQPT